MKKIIILSLCLIFLTGCNKSNQSNEIKPTSIYNPTPDDISKLLEEQKKQLQEENKSNEENNAKEEKDKLPFECKETEYEVYIAINKIRTENGLSELKWDEEMYKSILTRTDEISKKFSHTRPNGESCFSVYNKLHGENIAKDYPTTEEVVAGWMNSPGHKENILRKDFKKTAIGYEKKSSGTYWCQGFGY